MTARERTGKRDLIYNDWHREDSMRRYMTAFEAFQCAIIDIDFVEWCRWCKQPLALVEVQRSRNHGDKPYEVTRKLALAAGIKAFVVSFWTTDDDLDIEGLMVSQVAPELLEAEHLLPEQWAKRLYELRSSHQCEQAVA